MACLRLFTRPPLPPLPDFRVPLFLRRIALATRLPAALPYLLRLLRCGIILSRNSDANPVERVVFWDLDVGATVPARALDIASHLTHVVPRAHFVGRKLAVFVVS